MSLSQWHVCTACALVLATCSGSASEAAKTEAVRRLQADVYFLASDALEGRGTPSRGLDVAALYLETQLKISGVEPALRTSFRQTYKIGEYKPSEAATTIKIDGKLLSAKDYVLINIGRDPAQGPMDLEMVYAANGVVAEERNVNDYEGLDIRGKAVVVRKGAPWPPDPEQVFGPDRAMGKLMAATVRGAPLLVYLSKDLDTGSEAEAGFFREMKDAPVAFLREPGLGLPSALNPLLVLKPEALGADARQLKKGPLGKKIQISIEARVNEGLASNVLGKIPGRDPALREEWVVLSAHYDHLGSHSVPEGQDGIWNGADDNASGTAGVLEVAHRLAQNPGKRSVLVFFTSGEDRGILGSAYYAAHPVVPMEKVAVQLNLDMIGRSQGKVEGIAACAPNLFQQTAEVGKKRGVEVIPDQHPTWRVVYLTDVYHFAKNGVPGIEFFTGVHPDYHQPSDTADKIRYEEMARIVDTAAELARAYADGRPKPAFIRPAWFLVP